ncbi:hypothetical protein PV328_006064 [Microctonus aethiopoides]|uniref:Uncharacterized protein n=1 Tax=Microctonus aethiopoides TaxID=144406 RepID=A0AA39FNU2_9HYME|nr:hypothetical protein PV328_006064 [Microctonus aethiopoides]
MRNKDERMRATPPIPSQGPTTTTVKRMAARASLQLPPHLQILTPKLLFDWSSQNLPNINIRFSAIQQYDEIKQKLDVRFTNAKPIPATQKIQKVTPLSNYTVEVKPYSDSEKYSIHSTIKKIEKQSLRVEK